MAEAIIDPRCSDAVNKGDQAITGVRSNCWSTAPGSTCRSAAGPTWNWKAGTDWSRSTSTASCIACAVLPAMRKQRDGLHHQRRVLGRPVSPKCRGQPTHHEACGAGVTHSPSTWMNASTACAPAACRRAKWRRRMRKLRPVVPSEDEQAKMLQPGDCGRIAFVASMPPRVHERDVDQPGPQSRLHSDAAQPGLAACPHRGADVGFWG